MEGDMSKKSETPGETARRWYVVLFGKEDADVISELQAYALIASILGLIACASATLFFLFRS